MQQVRKTNTIKKKVIVEHLGVPLTQRCLEKVFKGHTLFIVRKIFHYSLYIYYKNHILTENAVLSVQRIFSDIHKKNNYNL